MRLGEYFKNINSRADTINKRAKNPFVDYDYSHNPFKGAFKHMYGLKKTKKIKKKK